MSGEGIWGMIIMAMCSLGSGILFYGIGTWSFKRKDPMSFWAGSVISPETICDIPAYNRANAKMWKKYSVPYFISGFLSLFASWKNSFLSISLIPLCFACTVGIWWLIKTYQKIEKQYKMQ